MRRIAKGDISDLTERECNSRRKANMQREYSESAVVPVRCNRFQRVHLSAAIRQKKASILEYTVNRVFIDCYLKIIIEYQCVGLHLKSTHCVYWCVLFSS